MIRHLVAVLDCPRAYLAEVITSDAHLLATGPPTRRAACKYVLIPVPYPSASTGDVDSATSAARTCTQLEACGSSISARDAVAL